MQLAPRWDRRADDKVTAVTASRGFREIDDPWQWRRCGTAGRLADRERAARAHARTSDATIRIRTRLAGFAACTAWAMWSQHPRPMFVQPFGEPGSISRASRVLYQRIPCDNPPRSLIDCFPQAFCATGNINQSGRCDQWPSTLQSPACSTRSRTIFRTWCGSNVRAATAAPVPA